MALAAQKQMEKLGQTSGCADHDHDLVHELSKSLDSLWRYDQYVANAEGKKELQEFWREQKKQTTQTIQRLKQLLAKEVEKDCF